MSQAEAPGGADILLIEDDEEIAGLLCRFLEGEGYRARLASDGVGMDAALARCRPDLVLLDIMLPGESGFDLCRRLRAVGDVRIIMVTALAETADRVMALDLGADDYVCKPFDLRELGARIRAVLRRPAASATGSPTDALADVDLHFEGWHFFPQRRYLRSPQNVRVALTGAETDLLLAFCQHSQEVLSRDSLLALTRGERAVTPERAIDLLVSRLRRKLAAGEGRTGPIETVRADGYRFRPAVSPA